MYNQEAKSDNGKPLCANLTKSKINDIILWA